MSAYGINLTRDQMEWVSSELAFAANTEVANGILKEVNEALILARRDVTIRATITKCSERYYEGSSATGLNEMDAARNLTALKPGLRECTVKIRYEKAKA